jgi:hypothetical protein
MCRISLHGDINSANVNKSSNLERRIKKQVGKFEAAYLYFFPDTPLFVYLINRW